MVPINIGSICRSERFLPGGRVAGAMAVQADIIVAGGAERQLSRVTCGAGKTGGPAEVGSINGVCT